MVNDPHNPAEFDPTGADALVPDDAAALDALFDRASHASPQRLEALEGLLGVLEFRSNPDVDGSLVDATLARVARARRVGEAEAVLAAADAEAVDALVATGFDPSRLDTAHARRGSAASSLLEMLGSHDRPLDSRRAALIQATLAKVDAAEASAHDKYRLMPELPMLRRRFQVADVVGIAAAVLLGISVLWPMLAEVRARGRRTGCEANLAMVGAAFGQYAGDYRDSLPLASPSLAGNPWWDVGTQPEHSNSANLFTVVRTGYTGLGSLACAGSPGACRTPDAVAPSKMDWRCSDNVSYSFQILFGRASQAHMSQSPSAILLSDRSPVVVRALRGEPIDPFANSLNHSGSGQNVLTASGGVEWIKSPVLPSGDNIWLPRSIEVLLNRSSDADKSRSIRGTETPEYQDVFVGP
jgi:hypothetical protein